MKKKRKVSLSETDVIEKDGKKLYRIDNMIIVIRATCYAPYLGGYIQSIDNAPNGCFKTKKNRVCGVVDHGTVYGKARVIEKARVEEHATVSGKATIKGHAIVCGDASVYDDAHISQHSSISGHAKVYEHAYVSGHAYIAGNAKVYGNASIKGHVVVEDDATVNGNATVCNECTICHNAIITGDVNVRGHARIGKDGYVTKSCDYICIGPIGSRNDFTTFYKTKIGSIMVSCGCFNDTLGAFKKRVIGTYGDGKYAKDYLAAIKFATEYLSTESECES